MEHILTIVGEECAEVAQRASKAVRFGLEEVQPGQGDDNLTRLMYEFWDLVGAIELLTGEQVHPEINRGLIDMKKSKVEKYLTYSMEVGTLETEP